MVLAHKLQVAVSGLGRMGQRHALHFLEHTPRASLVAACDPFPASREWAEQHLAPYGVKIYADFDEMLQHKGLEAVIVATPTTFHAEQSIKAINADKHVLCEKPLSISVEVSQTVVDAAKKRPHLKVMCGFSRRFDASYRDAFSQLENIGQASVIRSQTCDKHDPSGVFVNYAQHSGGLFVDCNIHDIDLIHWFLGAGSRVKSISAAGITAVAPGLAEWHDVDNGVGIIEFWGGKIAYVYGSRMMAAGQHDMTEIIGTKGKLVVGGAPQMNFLEVHEATGIRRTIPDSYYGRFREAFITEANEFTQCCLDDRELPYTIDEAVQALVVGAALQESVRTGRKLYFDELGNKVDHPGTIV